MWSDGPGESGKTETTPRPSGRVAGWRGTGNIPSSGKAKLSHLRASRREDMSYGRLPHLRRATSRSRHPAASPFTVRQRYSSDSRRGVSEPDGPFNSAARHRGLGISEVLSLTHASVWRGDEMLPAIGVAPALYLGCLHMRCHPRIDQPDGGVRDIRVCTLCRLAPAVVSRMRGRVTDWRWQPRYRHRSYQSPPPGRRFKTLRPRGYHLTSIHCAGSLPLWRP